MRGKEVVGQVEDWKFSFLIDGGGVRCLVWSFFIV